MAHGTHRLSRTDGHRRRVDRRGFRTRTARIPLLAAVVALVFVSAPMAPTLVTPSAGATVPGQPGTTQAGTVVFSDPFTTGTLTGPGTSILNYSAASGTGGMTYTALPPTASTPGWVPSSVASQSACNGWVMGSGNQPPTAAQDPQCISALAGSPGATAWSTLGGIADALGQVQGIAAGQNQILSAYTNATSGLQLAGVQVKTTTDNIPVIPGHYYAMSEWYGAKNCFASSDNNVHPRNEGPLAEFDLLDSTGANTVTNFGGAIDVCNAPGSTVINGVTVIKVQSPAFQMPAGNSTVGFQLQNLRATGSGNDSGFDLPQLVDVTPQLDKSFDSATIQAGGNSTLTFTVTNTANLAGDLGAKLDWSITDNLPTGVTVANPASFAGSCAGMSTLGTTAFSATASPDLKSISVVGGDLPAGTASCTVTVQVTSTVPGTYTNGPLNVTTNLNPPGTATLKVTPTCANPAPIYTVDNGSGVTANPRLISYDTTGAVLATVPLTASTGLPLLAPVTDIAMSADGSKLYGIATPIVGTPTLYTFDPATGKATGTVPVTGINWLTFVAPSALSVLPDGTILIGATGSRNLYQIDPLTGNATLYATLPVGYFSSGDFLTLPDATLLVLAGTPASPTTTTLFRYDPVALTFTAVGTVPASSGATQVGTMVYLAGSDGTLRTLGSAGIPTTSSTAALPTTTLTSLVSGTYLGATSAQDSAPVVCLNATKSAGTVTGPDATGAYSATYTVNEINSGTSASYGALVDSPSFSPSLVPVSATWTGPLGNGSATAPTSGPFSFTLAPAGTLIGIGAAKTHTYTVTVTFRFADSTTPLVCNGSGTGLFNAVAVPGGQETSKADDSACDTPPPRYGVYLHKVDASGVSLIGSLWTLQGAAAAGGPGAVIASGVQPAGQTGEFQMLNLQPGTYWLTETQAPAGYDLLAEPIKFVVSSTGAVSITAGGTSTSISVGVHSGSPEIVVGDQPALVLPLTGGSGPRPYALGGVVLLVLSGLVALLYRRRPATTAATGKRVRR
ncbi:MAG TPA: prealbumin-like fold domain-containing protein [Marmoricola sp.]|nr:prealbumin-like fold domain-containing protein [Marmoricola sp.]